MDDILDDSVSALDRIVLELMAGGALDRLLYTASPDRPKVRWPPMSIVCRSSAFQVFDLIRIIELSCLFCKWLPTTKQLLKMGADMAAGLAYLHGPPKGFDKAVTLHAPFCCCCCCCYCSCCSCSCCRLSGLCPQTRALTFLFPPRQVIHRDMKSPNVLLVDFPKGGKDEQVCGKSALCSTPLIGTRK